MTVTAGVGTLTAGQRARRARMLQAAVQLASAGGYEAVGMREVAEMAEVSLGTLYRHFQSKDHLLLAVMADSLQRLQQRLRKNRPAGDTQAQRVTEVLHRATRSMLRTPRLSAAILRSWVLVTGEPDADQVLISNTTRESILWAIHGEVVAGTDAELVMIKILSRVWFGELLFWANGRESDSDLMATVSQAVQLLLPE